MESTGVAYDDLSEAGSPTQAATGWIDLLAERTKDAPGGVKRSGRLCVVDRQFLQFIGAYPKVQAVSEFGATSKD